jgi:hypothetical protein
MGIVLGKADGITAQDRAILELKVQRDKLQHYQLKVSSLEPGWMKLIACQRVDSNSTRP